MISPPPRPTGDDLIAAHAFIWATAALLHLASFPDWLFSWRGTLYLAAALWTLERPAARHRFIALLIIEAVLLLGLSPNLANHLVLLGVASLTTASALLGAELRSRRSPLDSERVFDGYAVFVRAELLVLYAWTLIHKLNVGYLDAGMSCAPTIYARVVSGVPLPLSLEAFPNLAIWGSIVIEIAIPLLLCFRRSRKLGLLVGCGFHLFLSLAPRLGPNGLYSFSATIFAIYFLFAPRSVTAELLRTRARAFARMPFATRRNVRAGVLLLMGMQLLGWLLSALDDRLASEAGEIRYIGWGLWFVVGIAIAAVYVRSGGREPLRMWPPLRSPLLVFPLLMLANGLAPYLGLKTEYSFSMYSNLETEDGRWNHVLIPRGLRLVSIQDDLVEVLKTSDLQLERRAAAEDRINYTELRRVAKNAPADFTVHYRRRGVEQRVSRAQSPDHVLFRPMPYWEFRFLRFRPVSTGEASPCRH